MFAKLFFANVIIIIFFAKVLPHFKTFQRDRLVDVEKCCKTRIFLQRSVPIQPKKSNILLKFSKVFAQMLMKFCQNFADVSQNVEIK